MMADSQARVDCMEMPEEQWKVLPGTQQRLDRLRTRVGYRIGLLLEPDSLGAL